MLLGSLCYQVCQGHLPKAIPSSFPKMTVLLSSCYKNMELRYSCFPHSSIGKESACNVGNPISIPALFSSVLGLALWLSWLRICLQCGTLGFNPWVGKTSWRREMLPTPVFWPGEFHGLYSPRDHKELDTTEWTSLSLRYYHLKVQHYHQWYCWGRIFYE